MWWPADAARAPGHGDRHDIMGTGTMSGIPDMVTDTMPGIPIRNVQRATFNSQGSTG